MSAERDSGAGGAGAARPGGAEDLGEAEAWEALQAAWSDAAAHRAYLDRCEGLHDLAEAGRRYRAVLAERPGDAAAARGRDEVLKRATAAGLASLPRTPPPRGLPRWLAGLLFAAAGAAFLWALLLLARALHLLPRGRS